MSEPTITPALTPEEWANRPTVKGWDDGSVFLSSYGGQDVERPHAVAALLLEGQPFGFAREDVALLRGLAQKSAVIRRAVPCPDGLVDCYVLHEVANWGAEAMALFSLAARIEALLPPDTQAET